MRRENQGKLSTAAGGRIRGLFLIESVSVHGIYKTTHKEVHRSQPWNLFQKSRYDISLLSVGLIPRKISVKRRMKARRFWGVLLTYLNCLLTTLDPSHTDLKLKIRWCWKCMNCKDPISIIFLILQNDANFRRKGKASCAYYAARNGSGCTGCLMSTSRDKQSCRYFLTLCLSKYSTAGRSKRSCSKRFGCMIEGVL